MSEDPTVMKLERDDSCCVLQRDAWMATLSNSRMAMVSRSWHGDHNNRASDDAKIVQSG